MKLGIKIVFTRGGTQNGPAFNDTNVLTNYADDVRSTLKRVFPTREELKEIGKNPLMSFDESSKIIYFLKFIGSQGLVMAVIKAAQELPDRNFDNTAAWIHFPNNIDISERETLSLLEELSQIISDKYDIDMGRLKALANREYPSNDAFTALLQSSGENLAVLEYGKNTKYSLLDILGPSIRQPKFANYEAIFLIDKSLNIELWPNVEILKSLSVKPMLLVNNPKEFKYNNITFKPYIGTTLFDRPVRVIKGQPMKVIWRCSGFEDVVKQVDTTHDVEAIDINPSSSDVKFVFSRSWFRVMNEQGKPISNFTLEINGNKFTVDTLAVKYDNIKNGFSVTVSKNGYAPVDINMTLQSLNSLSDGIRMKKAKLHYEFTLPAYDLNGNLLKDKVYAHVDTTAKLGDTLIKGYQSQNGKLIEGEGYAEKNELESKSGTLMTKIIYAAIGAAAVALLWGVVAFFQHSGSNQENPGNDENKVEDTRSTQNVSKPSDAKSENNVESKPQPVEKKLDAKDYLDSNQVWKKSEMEAYPELKGLYDFMNTFNFDGLKDSRFNPLLEGKFYEIHKRVLNLKEGTAFGDNFDKKSPGEINVNEYIKLLESKIPGSSSNDKTKSDVNKKMDQKKPKNQESEATEVTNANGRPTLKK